MKGKRTAQPRRRFSFAVDRAEVEINSDWVEAVMASPAPATIAPFPAPPDAIVNVPPLAADPAPPPQSSRDHESGEGVFFAPVAHSSTGAESATAAECASVEKSAAVDEIAAVAESTAAADSASVEDAPTVELFTELQNNPVELLVTVANNATAAEELIESAGVLGGAALANATVAEPATVAEYATDAVLPSTKEHRVARPRPLRRITDGLTPGQYAVYSLMFEAGQSVDQLSRIYKGGYADLGRLTGLSKRGIQNIVSELQAKHVIAIHQQPGYHRTETTTYLVPDPDTVLQLWFSHGWRNAVGKSKALTP